MACHTMTDVYHIIHSDCPQCGAPDFTVEFFTRFHPDGSETDTYENHCDHCGYHWREVEIWGSFHVADDSRDE